MPMHAPAVHFTSVKTSGRLFWFYHLTFHIFLLHLAIHFVFELLSPFVPVPALIIEFRSGVFAVASADP